MSLYRIYNQGEIAPYKPAPAPGSALCAARG